MVSTTLPSFDLDDEDRAVSPVIGVILMVAITVILAAVIGTFVLNMSGSLQRNAQAGVTFEQTANAADDVDVTVQIISMSNADSVGYQVKDTSGTGGTDGDDGASGTVGSSVGDSVTLVNLEPGDTVTVTATLNGQTSVVQSYTVK